MKCPNCRRNYDDLFDFCPFCGEEKPDFEKLLTKGSSEDIIKAATSLLEDDGDYSLLEYNENSINKVFRDSEISHIALEYPEIIWALQKNRFDDAIHLIYQILNEEPDNSELWNILGLVFLELENIGQSIIIFNKALEIDQFNDMIWKNLGEAYLRQGKETFGENAIKYYEESIKCFSKAAEINPKKEYHKKIELLYSKIIKSK